MNLQKKKDKLKYVSVSLHKQMDFVIGQLWHSVKYFRIITAVQCNAAWLTFQLENQFPV